MRSYLRDRIYGPTLKFVLGHRFLSFSIFLALLLVTFASIGAGIIRVTIFPSIASDQVSINLLMPEGTNPEITSEIITRVEDAAWRVNDDFTARQTGG